MPESKSLSSRLDDATEAWARHAGDPWPGAARLFRRMGERRAFEPTALRYYQAIEEGRSPPEIRDGIQRHHAYVMGSTLAQRNKAVAETTAGNMSGYTSAPFRAIIAASTLGRPIVTALGLSLETSRDDVETAYGRHRARGGWAVLPRPEP